MNTIDGIIEDLELKESYVGGCTTKGEIIIYLENLKILQKEKETVLKALEDVEDEIDKLEDGISSYSDDRPWVYKDEVVEIIEQKIAEVKGDKE